jgi:hypothetical protein
MYNKNRAQQSVEFLIIFIFALVLIGLIIGFIGSLSRGITKDTQEEELQNFAEYIENEILIYEKAGGGYDRDFDIPCHYLDDYNLTLTDEYIILKSNVTGGEDGPGFYYELPGTTTPILNITGTGANRRCYITFEKESIVRDSDPDISQLFVERICSLDGEQVDDGDSRYFYSEEEVLGGSCLGFRTERQCYNGILKGNKDFKYASCSGTCELTDGTTIPEGDTTYFYSQNGVIEGSGDSCDNYRTVKTCVDGSFQGEGGYDYDTCEVVSGNPCTLDGNVVPSTESARFYSIGDPLPSQGSCLDNSQLMYCFDGNFYTDETYTVPADIVTYNNASCNNGCIYSSSEVVHGTFNEFYNSVTPIPPEACSSVQRMCNNGTYDAGAPGYVHTECAEGCIYGVENYKIH